MAVDDFRRLRAMMGLVNVVELEQTLFPGGEPIENLHEKVKELRAVHGADHIDGLLGELEQLLGGQWLGEARHAGLVSEIMPLTDDHKRRAAEALERQDEAPPQ
jgi:hypothetical protein